MSYSEINRVEKELVAEAQVLLKNEWMRVRRGEAAYRFSKVFAFIIVLGGLFSLLVLSVTRFLTNVF